MKRTWITAAIAATSLAAAAWAQSPSAPAGAEPGADSGSAVTEPGPADGPGQWGGPGGGRGMWGGPGGGPGPRGGGPRAGGAPGDCWGAGGHGPGWGPGAMRGYGQGYGHGLSGGAGRGYARALASLDLTDAQRDKIDEIHNEQWQKRWKLMGEMHELAWKQARARRAGAPEQSEADVMKAYDAMASLRRQMFQSAVETGKRIEAVLTPEQREKLKSERPRRR